MKGEKGMPDLHGKVALVTGAAMGNGKGIAECLLKHGADVILADRSVVVFETAKELGEKAYPLLVDITDKKQVEEAIGKVLKDYEKIDILVNNAGIARFSKFLDLEESLLSLHIKVNVYGAMNVTQCVLKGMVENGWGRIVNMSSVTGPYVADPGEVAYATSKAALIGFTKALAIEVAEQNITVNALCPGYILTPMVKKSAKESNPHNPDSVIDEIAAGIPMKRLGTPKNIGDLVAFLVSEEAEYITGQAITIDGGNGLPETNAMGLK